MSLREFASLQTATNLTCNRRELIGIGVRVRYPLRNECELSAERPRTTGDQRPIGPSLRIWFVDELLQAYGRARRIEPRKRCLVGCLFELRLLCEPADRSGGPACVTQRVEIDQC